MNNFSNFFRAINLNKKYLFYFVYLFVFFIFYALIINQIQSRTELKKKSFNSFVNSREFQILKDFISENLNSPYREYSYIVKNNDTIEKVLKKYNVVSGDINNIANKIVQKKLSNIFAGTEIKIVTKVNSESNEIISFSYTVNEITTVEIKRVKNDFIINKKILK